MRVNHPQSANVIEDLVFTLYEAFDATRDLYETLAVKERRDYEQSLRSKGYPSSRRIEYVKDDELGSDAAIALDKAAVKRQFEIGFEMLDAEFANGDVLAQTALQSQIIILQTVLVKTFLYGPTSSDPISHLLSKVNAASKVAGVASVDILRALQHRIEQGMSPTHVPTPSQTANSVSTHTTPYPFNTAAPSHHSTALMRYEPPRTRAGSPVNTTILSWRDRIDPERTDTNTMTMTGPSSRVMSSVPADLYCPYAADLQRHATQLLSSSITSDLAPHCPHCKGVLHLSSGKAWELFKEDDGFDRCFQVSNRFVVKCHRDGPDGQYACIICAESGSVNTVCGDVKALVKHLWSDHSIRELKHEQDIVEVIEQPKENRRDSGIGHSTPQSSKRSASLASSRRRRSLPAFEREVEIFDTRSFRRRA